MLFGGPEQTHLAYNGVPTEALAGRLTGDVDRDGDPDIAVSNSGGPLLLLRNDGRTGGWLGVQLAGRRSNRHGIGARTGAPPDTHRLHCMPAAAIDLQRAAWA